jgi:hypothetical protein
MVGMVVTISPSFSLYRMVVFPAASKPTMRMRISFFPHSLSKSFENVRPMIAVGMCCAGVVCVAGWWRDSRTCSAGGQYSIEQEITAWEASA